MKNPSKLAALVFALSGGVFPWTGAFAQDNTAKGIQQYRDALQDGNPAELWEIKGEGMWKQPRGLNKASMEKCDLGLGPGVVKGAYARLPKYFKDTERVDDLESRLVHCMVSLQGFTRADATRRVFGGPGAAADMEALVAYVTSQSKGVKMNVTINHPKEREAFQMGQKLFNYRGGSHDFACATCHGEDNKRIRLQDLPNLTNKKDAQRAYTTWPAYRVSQGELRSFQWRLYDCFRQQRFPEMVFASDASVALTLFLARNANGAAFAAPAIKR
ncbi:MAG: sulfur oxidation c-type cytochrome SoxA [Betaproteobacteria bacterium RIFCSPLOWO2_02_FULL_62_17]|nr:MAG: sulfur oxidation c-type cytochrome SoxA [Betaproteobacteria bacterium RIFCSPLOWO2_02_FULL_62_17]